MIGLVAMPVSTAAAQRPAPVPAPMPTLTPEGQRLVVEGQSVAATAPVWARASAPGRHRTMAPESWDPQDLADSLYRDARKALAANALQRAAELFREIRQKHPTSSYAPDAPYWEAFALHRIGSQATLALAQDALVLQQRDYPRAATRGDAAALAARIEAQLGRRGNVAAAQSVVERAERAASGGCPRAEDDERVDALNAVTQMDRERAMPILRKVLARREPCTQQLRHTALWLVARQKSPEAASLLVHSAKNDPDQEVREQAVFWLADVPTDEAVRMMIDLARSGDDLGLRKRAVYALSRAAVSKMGRTGSEQALSTLRSIATDTQVPEELRAEALGWYLRSAGPSPSESLRLARDLFDAASGTELKIQVLSALASRRDPQTRDFFVSTILDERQSLEVRRTATSLLVARGAYTVRTDVGRTRTDYQFAVEQPDAGVKALVAVYDRAADIEIRKLALMGLASSRNTTGTDKLLEVVRTEKHPELRRVAITHLSRSKDPRAIELLQAIINK
jgi:HEAT repeat protein